MENGGGFHFSLKTELGCLMFSSFLIAFLGLAGHEVVHLIRGQGLDGMAYPMILAIAGMAYSKYRDNKGSQE